VSDEVNATELTPLKRALLSIETLRERVRELESRRTQPIAVIGIGCRMPGGGNTPSRYFDALREGRDAIRSRPAVARPGWSAGDAELPPAGYLDDDVSGFDAAFFGISPREAMSIDPQHRLLLECAWEALEQAAIDPRALAGSRTGVFVGMAANDYANMQLRSPRAAQLLNSHFASGTGHSMVSGRLSYLLGVHGPSITVDTACSSSLVAVHLACESLRAGESEVAIAAGVNLILSTDYTVAFHQARMLAPDGRCKTFDASADGFTRGEGCGVLVLKPFADAQRDGDPILAVIRGSAVNQDGPSSGLTAPNGPAQEAVVRAALRNAGLKPSDIAYVEAHGTGTSLGDPIEVQALGNVFGGDRPTDRPLLIASVKTNIGHLEAAAGIAGLIKVVEALRQGEIPPSLHFRTPNPLIPWSELPVAVPTTNVPFEPLNGARRAGISSFGFSGTNAHIILEEVPTREVVPDQVQRASVLTLSAADADALRALSENIADHLDRSEDRFADVCHTLNTGRAHFSHRLAVIAGAHAEARDLLRAWQPGERNSRIRQGYLRTPEAPAVAFLFTGQGSQYAGMAWSLRQVSPVVRTTLDRCDELLRSELEVPLLNVLDPNGRHPELIDRTDYTQLALFAVQVALAELWRSWGITPSIVLGHSIGEYAAAYLAGVFNLEDAVRVVAARGRLMQATPPGRMLAVMTEEARVRDLVGAVGGPLSIAAVNAPAQIVISGANDAVAELDRRAAEAGVQTKPLRTSHAFHSPLMDDAVPAFESVLRSVSLRPADRVRFVSTVTGTAIAPDVLAEVSYWSNQIRQPVRFADAVRSAAAVAAHGVEVGPHPTLSALASLCNITMPVHPSLHRERDAWETLLTTAAELYVSGTPVAWQALDPERPANSIELPRYPFQRSSLWVDLGAQHARRAPRGGHPLLGVRIPQPPPVIAFESVLDADAPAFIADHRVLDRVILPGTAYLEMAMTAGATAMNGAVELHDVEMIEPMLFDDGNRLVHTRIDTITGTFSIHSAPADSADHGWTLHCSGRVSRRSAAAAERVDITAALERCTTHMDGFAFAAQLASRGYDFGPRLLGVREVFSGTGEAVGQVVLPEACADDPNRYTAHPLLLDAAVQTIATAMSDAVAGRTWVPVAIDTVATFSPLRDSATTYVRIDSTGPDVLRASVHLTDESGVVLARLGGMAFRAVSAADLGATSEDPFLEVKWVPVRDAHPEQLRRERAETLSLAHDTMQAEAKVADTAAYDVFVDTLEARSLSFVADALGQLGWDAAPGDIVDAATLAADLGVVPARLRLFERMLEMLSEERILDRHANGWLVRRDLRSNAQSSVMLSVNGSARAEQVLLERCGAKLHEMLRGNGDPLELLFPGGDAEDAEQMYYDAPLARTFNRTIAALVASVRAVNGRKLRILEVGGGTAGTTRRVLEALDAHGIAFEYTFTDISPLFLDRGRRRWANRSGIVYRTFDLDGDAAAQGFESQTYDIVIAANCLHAARDLRGALARVRNLLRPAGMLLAVEVFGAHRWFDLTVGLTDGWWHFTDTDLRPTYPCIDAARWENTLSGLGYNDVHALPLSSGQAGGHASRNQGLVIAYRDAAPLAAGTNWLLLGSDAFANEVADGLTGKGCTVVRCDVGTAAAELAARLREQSRWQGIVLVHTDRAHNAANVSASIREGAEALITLAKVVGAGVTVVDRVCLASRGAQVASDADVDVDAAAATLWGITRTLELELPEVRVDCLDLDATASNVDADLVVNWLLDPPAEPELAVRFDQFRERRVVRRTRAQASLPAEYRLLRPASSSLDNIAFSEGARRQPAAGEVEIRVAASGVNFKDVLNVLGMYPGDAGPLGSECAGVVTAVGADVNIPVGTAVVASAGHAYGRHVIARAELVAPKPAHLTFAQAAAVPVAYLTAHFALNHLGGIGPGDRVLIHAAAGGVGMAACALAQRAGAEVFATAGSEAKRERLRAAGIRHVFDSRSASFVDGILAETNGAGVTVVLNSLADDLVARSFDVLAKGGRFLEIGKRGIWTHEQVAALDRDVDYHIIDWGETVNAEPALVGRLFADVMRDVASGELPALPVKVFPLERTVDAFRYMAAGRHTGKIVLAHPVHAAAEPIRFTPDGVYLITGGTAGLGLSTARWAVTQGAGEIVLVSRSGGNAETSAFADEAARTGARVHVFAADIGDRAAVTSLLNALRDRGVTRIDGFIHSAGALADRTLQNAEWSDFERVLHAKVGGTLHLAEAAREMRSDFLVSYASIASVLGAPGQANHAAANAFQDSFAAGLWSAGIRGMTIGWGPWSETGAATAGEVLNRARDRGITALSTREGIAWTERAFARPAVHLVGAKVGDAAVLARASRHLIVDLPSKASATKHTAPATASTPTQARVRLADEIAAAPVDARRTLMLNRVRDRIRRVLGLAANAVVEAERPLGDLGLDSLLAVELRNVLAEDVERRLPATLLFDHATPSLLADHLLDLIAPAEDQDESDAQSETESKTELVGLVESLDDDEVERLLAEKLKQS